MYTHGTWSHSSPSSKSIKTVWLATGFHGFTPWVSQCHFIFHHGVGEFGPTRVSAPLLWLQPELSSIHFILVVSLNWTITFLSTYTSAVLPRNIPPTSTQAPNRILHTSSRLKLPKLYWGHPLLLLHPRATMVMVIPPWNSFYDRKVQ